MSTQPSPVAGLATIRNCSRFSLIHRTVASSATDIAGCRWWPGMLVLLLGLTAAQVVCSADPPQPDFWDPVPKSPSTTAPEKIHDKYWYGQFMRVNQAVAQAKQTQVVFFGDSITLAWSHMLEPEGKLLWDKQFGKYHPINMGNSGDITPVMLYRITHGNLDFPAGKEPKVAVLLCGTNNYVVTKSARGHVQWDLGIDTPPREVADGIRAVAQEFRRQLPTTRVIVLGILPVKNAAKWKKCQATNRILSQYRYPPNEVVFMDLAERFTNKEGTLKGDLFTDGTHLTTKGYQVMADAIAPVIARLVKLGPIQQKQKGSGLF